MPRVRRNKKDKEDEKNVSILLPPCLVCEGKASGLHFGVNTCEACKAFFRRCLQRDKEAPLICPNDKNCTIYFQNKFLCPYCRFQKCLGVGMSKEAIKTGRYTLEHKAGLIKQAGSRRVTTRSSEYGDVTLPPDQPTQPVSEEFSDVVRVASPEREILPPPLEVEIEHQVVNGSSEESVWKRSVAELEEIMDVVLKAFQTHTPYTEEIKARIHKEQSEFKSQRDLIEELFGPMKPLSREEYLEIYKTTGIDIDGRMEKAKTILPTIKKSITSMVQFARSVPRFTELPINDQLLLVEGCGFEWWVINAGIAVNVEGGLFTSFFGITQTKAEMVSNHHPCSASYVDQLFDMAAILKEVKTDGMTDALLAAICATNPEGRDVTNPQKTEDIQYPLIEALSLHLSRTKRHPLKVLHTLLDACKQMRSCRRNILGRKDDGQYISPMGAYMAPMVHQLMCEPPPCEDCQIEPPCDVHQHYLPQNLPTFQTPPPQDFCTKNLPMSGIQSLIKMAMGCSVNKDKSTIEMTKDNPLAMPIDYSAGKQPSEMGTCTFLPNCIDKSLCEESTNTPIDYSTYDMRSDSSPCCLSVSSEGTDCLSPDVQGKLRAFEQLSNVNDSGGESLDSFSPGKGIQNLMPQNLMPQNLMPKMSASPSSGTFDKWQALQQVCQHFIDECESESESTMPRFKTETDDSQMDVEMEGPSGYYPYGGKNMEALHGSRELHYEPMDQTDRMASSASITTNGKNEAMLHSWRAPSKPQGKPATQKTIRGRPLRSQNDSSNILGHQGGKNIEALSYRKTDGQMSSL